MREKLSITNWPCEDGGFNEDVAIAHQKTKAQHDTMVTAFFGSANVAAKVIDMADERINLNIDCNVHFIMFIFDSADIDGNDDIDITMYDTTQGPPVLTGTLKHAFYTIPMFKGMMEKFGVTSIHVRKAKETVNGSVRDAVVIEGWNDANVVYHGNLTSQIPTPHFVTNLQNKKRNMKKYNYPYDLNDQKFLQDILDDHQIISDDEWNAMIHEFMLGNFAAPHSLAIADLKLPADLNNWLMKIWFDPADNTSHTINWKLVPWDGHLPGDIADGVCYFSALFLKAIDNRFHPDHLDFYKLKEKFHTGIIAAGFNVIDVKGDVKFHADITSQFPTPPLVKNVVPNLP